MLVSPQPANLRKSAYYIIAAAPSRSRIARRWRGKSPLLRHQLQAENPDHAQN